MCHLESDHASQLYPQVIVAGRYLEFAATVPLSHLAVHLVGMLSLEQHSGAENRLRGIGFANIDMERGALVVRFACLDKARQATFGSDGLVLGYRCMSAAKKEKKAGYRFDKHKD